MMTLSRNDRHIGPQSLADVLQQSNLRGLVLDRRAGQCQVHKIEYVSKLIRGFGGNPPSWSVCPQCAEEAGRRADAQAAKEARIEAEQARAQAAAARLVSTGVPKRFVAKTWDNYRTTETPGEGPGTQAYALRRCKSYADNFERHLEAGRTLILYGNTGTGKNHLATCVVRQLTELGYSAVFTTASMMITAWEDIKMHRVDNSRGVMGLLRDFVSPQLLVLDELFKQSATPAATRFLFDVLNARYEAQKPTALITNYALEQMERTLDPVLVSRLNEARVVVPFPWQDQRGNVGRGGN